MGAEPQRQGREAGLAGVRCWKGWGCPGPPSGAQPLHHPHPHPRAGGRMVCPGMGHPGRPRLASSTSGPADKCYHRLHCWLPDCAAARAPLGLPQCAPEGVPAEGKDTLTCFIRSKSKASRATSFTLPAGFILGRGRRVQLRQGAGTEPEQALGAPGPPAWGGPCGMRLPRPVALQTLFAGVCGHSLATEAGSAPPPGPQGCCDHVSQPKRQGSGSDRGAAL